MTLFKWTEIRKWADNYNLKPKKVGTEYHWEEGVYKNLDDLAKALFNNITNNKFLEHQKNYDAQI
jgi:hypothetical protein